MATAEPEDAAWQHKITLIFIKVGDVLIAEGNFAEALKSYRDALAVADRFAKSDPENADWQRNLSLAYNKIGDALAAGGNHTEALEIFLDSLEIRKRLAKADSSNTDRQRDLAITQGHVAAALAEQGDASRALDMLQQGRVIIAGLVEQSPDNDRLVRTSPCSMPTSRSWSRQARLGWKPRNRDKQSGKLPGNVSSWHEADLTLIQLNVCF